MKTIYLMRHGQTLFNVMKLNQGQCDSPLTEAGIEQAKNAGKWYQDHGITFDAVYSSSSERACDTAELASDHMPYARLKGLKEIYLGTLEASSIVNNPEYPYGDYFIKYGGESLNQVTERIYHTIHELAEADNGNTILIVSHGLSIRRFLEKIGYRGLEREFIGNCGIVELQYENDIFTVKQVVNVNPEKPE